MRIELREAGFTYLQGTPFASIALAGVSLCIQPGERIGITGPVGSGKSTLLELLAGLRQPGTGSVYFDGLPAARGRKKTVPGPGRIGIAFQSPESCLFEKTVIADVESGPRNLGINEAPARERAEAALKSMGLDPVSYGRRSPWSLSTGEQRRVALAGLLALEPEVLLLDEPSASLDPAARESLTGQLLKINGKGVTIVIVGHDMDEMARFARRLVIIDEGRLAADGPAAALLTDTGLMERHSLEAPATVRLSGMLAQATGRPVPPFLTEASAASFLLGLSRPPEPREPRRAP